MIEQVRKNWWIWTYSLFLCTIHILNLNLIFSSLFTPLCPLPPPLSPFSLNHHTFVLVHDFFFLLKPSTPQHSSPPELCTIFDTHLYIWKYLNKSEKTCIDKFSLKAYWVCTFKAMSFLLSTTLSDSIDFEM